MLNDFLLWAGWSEGSGIWQACSLGQSFWCSPLGLFCTAILSITSIIRVMHWKVNASVFDTFWHFAMSLTTGAAFMVGLNGGSPQRIVKTLVVLMTIRGVYKCIGILRNDSCKAKPTHR